MVISQSVIDLQHLPQFLRRLHHFSRCAVKHIPHGGGAKQIGLLRRKERGGGAHQFVRRKILGFHVGDAGELPECGHHVPFSHQLGVTTLINDVPTMLQSGFKTVKIRTGKQCQAQPQHGERIAGEYGAGTTGEHRPGQRGIAECAKGFVQHSRQFAREQLFIVTRQEKALHGFFDAARLSVNLSGGSIDPALKIPGHLCKHFQKEMAQQFVGIHGPVPVVVVHQWDACQEAV